MKFFSNAAVAVDGKWLNVAVAVSGKLNLNAAVSVHHSGKYFLQQTNFISFFIKRNISVQNSLPCTCGDHHERLV